MFTLKNKTGFKNNFIYFDILCILIYFSMTIFRFFPCHSFFSYILFTLTHGFQFLSLFWHEGEGARTAWFIYNLHINSEHQSSGPTVCSEASSMRVRVSLLKFKCENLSVCYNVLWGDFACTVMSECNKYHNNIWIIFNSCVLFFSVIHFFLCQTVKFQTPAAVTTCDSTPD